MPTQPSFTHSSGTGVRIALPRFVTQRSTGSSMRLLGLGAAALIVLLVLFVLTVSRATQRGQTLREAQRSTDLARAAALYDGGKPAKAAQRRQPTAPQ